MTGAEIDTIPRRGLSSRPVQWLSATAVLVVMSYAPALRGGFVWDDVIFSEEPVIHAVSGLKSIWLSPADIRNEGHYWPLVYTTFWLEHQLWGLRPAGYHAVNILLHLVNCLLLWRLLERRQVPGAAVIAAVFAVHPVHVESVAWIIERKDVLSALCYLGAVLVWVRFVERPGPARYALALALFTAGLLAKTVVVTLPAALLIWHWWRRGRVTAVDLLRLAPFAAVGVAITLADLAFYQSREPLELGYTLVERALIAARALWFYLGKLLWPVDLAVIYPLWEIDAGDPLAWAYLAAAAALAAALWLARRRIGRGPLAGAAYFAVTLAPVLGFVDFGYMQFSLVADRFQYLAGIGVLAVLIGAAAHGVARLPDRYHRGSLWLAAVVVVTLSGLTWRQAGVYRDEITLFSHVVAHNPSARDAHLNLSSALFEADRFDEGLAASRIAVAQRPESAGAHSNVGRALIMRGELDEAEEHLLHARGLDARNTSALQNLGEVYRKQGRYEDAVASYRAVLDVDSGYALAYAGMGTALFHLQRHDEALQAMTRAVDLRLDAAMEASLRLQMGRAARALGRLEGAAEQFRLGMESDPGNTEFLIELAGVRIGQQRHDEADELLRRARELRPRDPATHHHVAEALRKHDRFEAAMEAYGAALAIDASFAPAHAGRGIALYRRQRYDEALPAMARALSLQPDLPVASTLHLFMGHAREELAQPEAAAEHFHEALRIDARNTEAIDRLAMLRFGQERYEEAFELYRTLAELKPGSAQTHSNLGATLYYLGRRREALRSFERALALDPDLRTARGAAEQLRTELQ